MTALLIKLCIINSSAAYTAETGGTTISICHSSREGFKALWIPHTDCWLEKFGHINTTSWHACHLRKPPVHTHAGHLRHAARTTQVRCSLMRPSTCDQHFPLCPLDTSAPLKGFQMCDGADVKCGGYHLSGEALMEEHACTYGQSGRFTGWAVWECSVDIVFHRFYCLSGYFATTHPDQEIFIYE